MSDIQVFTNLSLKITRTPTTTRESKYPWDALQELNSGFAVPAEVGAKGFRSLALQQGKKRGKVFSVIRDEAGAYWCVYTKDRKAAEAAEAAEATAADEAVEEQMADVEAAVAETY